MEKDLAEIRKKIVKLIEKLDGLAIYGAIPYLETCEEMLDSVEAELEAYSEEVE